MTSVEDVIRAHAAICEAEANYRRLLREALRERGAQAAIAKALGVTREKLRVDALPDDEREEIKKADARRKAELRERAKQAAEAEDAGT